MDGARETIVDVVAGTHVPHGEAPRSVPEELAGGTEQLVICLDRASAMRAVIAIDDTTLGPGLGGVRYAAYPSVEAATVEATRLARAMTLKNACAGIPYGGAKSVILRSEAPAARRDVMRAFGRFVGRLGGAYVPGVDMGTSVEDLAVIGELAPDVSCDHVDPSPYTAVGVLAAIEAAVAVAGHRSLDGVSVLVQGVGHVGHSLAARLAAQGATVMVADVEESRASAVADEIGATVVPSAAVTSTPCDVFAPCATARVIDDANVGSVPFGAVVGAANDVLAHRRLDRQLAARGILYVPDFVANAGGVIQIHAIRAGWDDATTGAAVRAIGGRVSELLERAAASGATALEAAEQLASERIGREVHIPS